MVRFSILTALLALSCFTLSLTAADQPTGFASVSGLGLSTTTGGEGGQKVTVTTWSELEYYAESSNPYIILVEGTINAPSNGTNIDVKSNKTIVGLGDNATLYQAELRLLYVSNIIIRNLTIRDSYVEGDYDGKTNDYDAIQADGSDHIWIDHCHFTHCGDGLIDLRKVCDYVTVSWVHLSNHNKCFGLGWTEETDFRTTINNCWFDSTNQRNPSFDMGIGHLYNNYGSNITSYGHYARGMAQLVIENCVFEDSNNPITCDSTAACYISGMQFINCTGSRSGNTTTMPYDPADYYSYYLYPTSEVKSIVTAESGPKTEIGQQYIDTPDTTPPTPDPLTWAVEPYSTGGVDIAMQATTATDSSGVQYYFANLTESSHDSGWIDVPSWTDTALSPGTTYSYAVKARDNSNNANETDWSEPASAATADWLCSSPIKADFSDDCRINMTDFAMLTAKWAETPIAQELIENGSFDSVLTPWTTIALSGASGTTTSTLDSANGNPPASALLETDTGTTGANNNRFFQAIPVTVGSQYIFSGDWAGDITGTVDSDSLARNWAEVIITFEDSNYPASSTIVYKKAYGNGDLNTTDGIWSWESITGSPNGTSAPTDGVFTATAPYMIVSFNLGGRANSGTTQISVDNISVTEVLPCPEYDLNDDCQLNILDLTIFAENWLNCNREPESECF